MWVDEEALAELEALLEVFEEAAMLVTEEAAVEANDDVDGDEVSSVDPCEAALLLPPSLTQLTVINGKARMVRTLKNFFMKTFLS